MNRRCFLSGLGALLAALIVPKAAARMGSASLVPRIEVEQEQGRIAKILRESLETLPDRIGFGERGQTRVVCMAECKGDIVTYWSYDEQGRITTRTVFAE